MSDHEYTPKSKVGKWFNDRLPLLTLANHLTDYPTPKNLNYWWTFGGILTFCLITQIITGIVLGMHYVAHADLAFQSVEHIMRDVNYGWLIRYVHANGASMFFLAVYIHIFRSLYYGSYKSPREVIWIIGMLIYFLMMATAFMGYVLPWGQMSFWGATVITNLFSAIPLVGESITNWLWGGYSVDNPTLTRFFSLHYLFPFLILGLVVLHIWALHVPGNNNPIGIDIKKPSKDTVPFHPYIVIKDAFALLIFLLIFAFFVFFSPNILGHADNYIEANPLVTPAHIVPEWYLLPFYAILRSVPDKLLGVIAMFAAIFVLVILPWLDTSKVRSTVFRPIYKQFYWFLVADVLNADENISNEQLLKLFHLKSYNEDSKSITNQLLEKKYDISMHNNLMNETDRTIVALLWHENIIDKLEQKDKERVYPIYYKILRNICFADYIDRITFQSQIWEFNEMSSLIKTFYNNKIFHDSFENEEFKPLNEIRFTKVLTKYSTEYNNSLFIQDLSQKLCMDKKDIVAFFQEIRLCIGKDFCEDNEVLTNIENMFEDYDICKLDIKRFYRYLDKNSKKDAITDEFE